MAYDPAARPCVANVAAKLPSAWIVASRVAPLTLTDTTCPEGIRPPAATVPDRVTDPVPKMIVGELRLPTTGVTRTPKVAAADVALPTELRKTARYWEPFWEAAAVKLRVAEVAPATSAKVLPPSVLTCHWTVAAGL